MKKLGTSFFSSSLILLAIAIPVFGEDWSRFRGPNGSGVSSAKAPPLDFSTESNVAWKVEVGAGTSSPIIVADRLFMTSFEGDQRSVKCLDANTGKELWSKSVVKLRDENATPPNNPATCTPAANGNQVCALFPDAGLFSYSLDGKLLWEKDLGPFYSMHGISSSPTIVGDKLIMSFDQLRDPAIVALDLKSGNEVWRAERFLGITGGYSSPGEIVIDGKPVVVSIAPSELILYSTDTGQKVLSSLGVANAPIAVPVVIDNRIYYSESPFEPIPMSALGTLDKNGDGMIELEEVKSSLGTYRLIERIDKGFGNDDGKVELKEWEKAFETFVGGGGLSCLQIKRENNELKTELVWQQMKSIPYIPSLIVVDDLLYTIDDGGVLSSYDVANGELVKRERLGKATGQYYASPVSGGGVIVLANNEGKVSLIKAGKDWSVINTVDLAEPINATPAIHEGVLYIRTEKHLYAFGK